MSKWYGTNASFEMDWLQWLQLFLSFPVFTNKK